MAWDGQTLPESIQLPLVLNRERLMCMCMRHGIGSFSVLLVDQSIATRYVWSDYDGTTITPTQSQKMKERIPGTLSPMKLRLKYS